MRRLWFCLFGLLFLSAPAIAQKQSPPILVLNADGHTGKITKLSFTPDGKELVTVSDDKTVRIWSVATGRTEQVLHLPIGPGQDGWLYALAVSPDGKTLAVGERGIPADEHGKIYLISRETGRVRQVLLGHKDLIYCLAFSPDGRWLASGSADFTARVWDLTTGRSKYVLSGHTQLVRALTFAPDSRHLLSGSFDYSARIWSLATGKSVAELVGHKKEIACVAWSPDGRTLVTGSRDESISLWSPAGKRKARYTEMGDEVTSLSFTPDSSAFLYTLGGNGKKNECGILDLKTDKDRVVFKKHNNTVSDGALSPDGTLAATAGGDNPQVYLWRTRNAAVAHHLIGKGKTTWTAAWSTDGKSIAWGTQRDPTHDLFSQRLTRAFSLGDLRFMAKGKEHRIRGRPERGGTLLDQTGLNTLAVRQGRKLVSTLKLPRTDDVITGFSLLAGDRAAVGSIFGLYLYDTETGKLVRSFRGHQSLVWNIAPSPDGKYLLSCSLDQTLRIWKMDQSLPLLSLFFAGDEWIAWTPEGYYAASLGGERLIGWQVNNGTAALGSFYPAAQFRKKLYRPDVIKRLLDAGSLGKALAAADQALGQETTRTEVSAILPPKVDITSPLRMRLGLKENTLEIQVSAQSVGKRPVQALRLLLDGRPYQTVVPRLSAALPHDGDVQATWKVEIPPGRHFLSAQATSSVSEAISNVLEVVYTPPGQLEVPPGNLYVLAIGINEYPGALKLGCAVADARDVNAVFRSRSRGLFGKIESKILLNKDATRAQIEEGLRWLRAKARPGDLALVFYAGHGYSTRKGAFYILPADVHVARGRIKDLATSCLSGAQLREELGKVPCNGILILDACFSGSILGMKRKPVLPQGADAFLRALHYEESMIVMCGAAKEQEAAEENGHGYFTRALVAGLSGKAVNRSGLVTVDRLHPFVRGEVLRLSDGEQEPTFAIPSAAQDFPLSRP